MSYFISRPHACGTLVALILLAGCQQHTDTAPSQSAPVQVATSASTSTPTPTRSKPDFGGVTSQYVEVTASGSSLPEAVNNAIALAIEQVNGKVMSASSLRISDTSAVDSASFAESISSSTDGAITRFKLISQQQVNTPVHTDEESLQASQDASWNKGSVDASASRSSSAEHEAEMHASESAAVAAEDGYAAHAATDNAQLAAGGYAAAAATGEAHVTAGEKEIASNRESAYLNGHWDVHTGGSRMNYDNKHVDYASHWEVRIGANVATYKEAASAKLTRIMVARPIVPRPSFQIGDREEAADAIAGEVQSRIAAALSDTQRFTVLDRQDDQQIASELQRISSGNASVADTARLGQQLATDLIVIPSIDSFDYVRHEHPLHMANRTLVSYSGGASVSFRLVNATTGQMLMSQSYSYAFPSTAPTTMGVTVNGQHLVDSMLDAMGHSIISSILLNTYPLSVLEVQGSNLVINQGGDALKVGTSYQAVFLGKQVMDPQTGQSLGPTESPCCSIKIDRIAPNLSYGHIVETGIQLPQPFVPGSIELRAQVASNPASASTPRSHAVHRPAALAEKHVNTATDSNADW